MGKKLIRPLRIAGFLVFLLAVAAAIPSSAAEVAGVVMVGVLVAAPLLRVAFFVGRWWQIGDRRFAMIALLLLVEIGAGTALALV
ncbi:MAG TPA: hypothetical protein VI916_06195 [Acidimicrobiia bacterium]|nr:hypothetical protein [Acidimicrobiia bacterium]